MPPREQPPLYDTIYIDATSDSEDFGGLDNETHIEVVLEIEVDNDTFDLLRDSSAAAVVVSDSEVVQPNDPLWCSEVLDDELNEVYDDYINTTRYGSYYC